MFYKILFHRTEKLVKKANRRAKAKDGLMKMYRARCRNLKRELASARKQKALLEDGYIVEWCINCNKQVTMLWDLEEDGFTAFCPYCGEKMMLCEQCQGECDYNYGFDICKEM